MNIAIIGTGYVGLPTGVGFAELGNQVICIDKDRSKIEKLRNGEVTLYEEGLEDLLTKNIKEGRIAFSSTMEDSIKQADIIILAVGTPPHPVTKQADMSFIYAAAKEMATYLSGYTIVAVKSTVPVGTGDQIEKLIQESNPMAEFDVVSLPEFLREGFAVHDFFNPDRIVIGCNSDRALGHINELYAHFINKLPILYVSRRSSETIKYASNAFLAMKIHYINEMANFCEKSGADITEVAAGMGLDSRIGNKFLSPGPGYGGSCFPKDTQAMAYMAKEYNVDLTLVESTILGNQKRKVEIAERIIQAVKGIENPRIAVLGLTFKGGTDDCRESPAIEIISELLKTHNNIIAHDPKGINVAKTLLGDQIEYSMSIKETLFDADILVVLTEWDAFKNLNLKEAKILMKNHFILDFRNILDAAEAKRLGFSFSCIGRQNENDISDWRSGIYRIPHGQGTEKTLI